MDEQSRNELAKLPKEAIANLKELYLEKRDLRDSRTKIEVIPDPKVEGTFAVQLIRYIPRWKRTETFHFLWYDHFFDECEFSKWPPMSGIPRILI